MKKIATVYNDLRWGRTFAPAPSGPAQRKTPSTGRAFFQSYDRSAAAIAARHPVIFTVRVTLPAATFVPVIRSAAMLHGGADRCTRRRADDAAGHRAAG